jgi:femAB family protein
MSKELYIAMTLDIIPKETTEIYDTPIVQQTAFWTKVKQRLGVNSRAFDFKAYNRDLYLDVGGYSSTRSDVIFFLQRLNANESIAYFPYGPEVEPSEENQGRFLEELSESLRPYLPHECIALRYDLNWRSHWCKEGDFDEQGHWKGLPETPVQEFQMNYNTRTWNLRKSNSNILPSNTILLDLQCSEELILARMKPKTRYNIKVAQRKGVQVRSEEIGKLGVWYKLYRETAARNGLNVNDKLYFQSVFAARMEAVGDVQVKLLIAYADDVPLAAMFLVMSAHRATYLYGASSSEKRNLMPTYALQWEAIRTAKTNSCAEYDLFGVAPCPDPSHPMYGLYKFKQGFGGELFRQMGCWDYPLNEERYDVLRACEMRSKGYYR